VTLTFVVVPADVAGLKITVDGDLVAGASHSLAVDGGRKVVVAARARGYVTWSRSVTVRADQTFTIKLQRPAQSDSGPGGGLDL
jgi:hypothetical protein